MFVCLSVFVAVNTDDIKLCDSGKRQSGERSEQQLLSGV
jgi:hypothetical protein